MNFKRLTIFAILSLALVAAAMLPGIRRASAAQTLIVGNNIVTCPNAQYFSIQSAVNAAHSGDTITVCAGTYHELVTVNKQLTLLGAQAGVDARSATRTGLPATESVVDGNSGTTSFYVTANDVTINGFTVQGATIDNVFGAGIVLGGGTSGAHVVYNIIQNNIAGLFLSNAAGGNQCVIQYNLFRNNTQPGSAGGHGIYSDEFSAGGTVSNVLIDSNRFTGNTWGIGISNSGTQGPYSSLSIQNNTFDANSRGMYFFDTANSSITSNTITNSAAPVRYGIGFFGGDSSFTIHCNIIQNNPGEGILVEDDIGSPNSNITVNDNNIAGNATAGLEVVSGGYTGVLNAEMNWWGSATGPTSPSNPGGTGDKVIDPNGVVDFTPFRTSPVPDADNDGILDPCDSQIGPPTNKDQCKNGGWQNFNFPHTFKNQGDCIQYVNTGK